MHERRPFLRSNSNPASQAVNGIGDTDDSSSADEARRSFGYRKRPSSSSKRTVLRLLEHLEEEQPIFYYTSLVVTVIGGIFVVGIFAGQVIGSFIDDGIPPPPPVNNNLRYKHHRHRTSAPTYAPTIEIVHPFLLHYPDDHLPHSFKKDYSLYSDSVPKENEICYVHVGKTAGSTVGCALGFGLHCHKHDNMTPGLLPQYSTREFHTSAYDCFDDSAYYLFVVRDPLDRLVSAFNYEKPSDVVDGNWSKYEQHYNRMKNGFAKLYGDCFDSINDLAESGLSPKGGASKECKERAVEYVVGMGPYGYHHYYNYQFHLEGVPENATIMTIRQNYLVDDWNGIEHLIGGVQNILGPNQTVLQHNNVHHAANATAASSDTTNSTKNATTFASDDTNATSSTFAPSSFDEKYLSNYSKSLICEKLCNEIQVYKKILSVSINLSKEDVDQSIEDLKKNCPLEAEAATCASVLPDITGLLMYGRGYDPNVVLDNSTLHEITIGRKQIVVAGQELNSTVGADEYE